MKRIALALTLLASLGLVGATATAPGPAVAAEQVTMKLATGDVVIELRPDIAPKHVERIKKLVSEEFYDGVVFHRVLGDFMAQTGDPTGTGTSGSTYPDLPAEFTDTPFVRGTIGAARTMDPNSANSQFFICFTDQSCAHLAGQYTVWGQVVSGMEHIDTLKKGAPGSGAVQDPDKVISMRMTGS